MSGGLDHLVTRARLGEADAMDQLLGLLRGPLSRQARRLGVREASIEDAVQETLIDIARGFHTYRGTGSFLSWSYTAGARRAYHQLQADQAAVVTDRLEAWLADGDDPLTEAEQLLLEQDVHLRCAMAIAHELTPALRRAYLMGELLRVGDAVGAEALEITRAAFRQRVARARRVVNAGIAEALAGRGERCAASPVGDELQRLVDLGNLHRAHHRRASGAAGLRALQVAAPTLAGPA